MTWEGRDVSCQEAVPREEAEGGHPSPADLPAAQCSLNAYAGLKVEHRAGRQVEWMRLELADWRRHVSSRGSKGGGWEPGALQPPQGAPYAGGATRPYQQLRSGGHWPHGKCKR